MWKWLLGEKETNKSQNVTNEQIQVKPILNRLIDKGGYGEVYHGEWKLKDVAIKKLYLSPHNTSLRDNEDIMNEINTLKKLKGSPYVIQFYDTYSDDHELLIIMDYAENGTLTKFINDNKDKEHDWGLNTNLIKQIVLGLDYIHQEKIIHRDLKSMNILLTNNYQVKITDFGLSKTKIVSSSQFTQNARGTLRWMAPEILREQKYSKKSDIYSLGMIIWEIAAKCTVPFKDVDNNFVYICIISEKKETIPSDAPQNIQDIIKRCWKDNPSERISLVNMLEMVETYLTTDISFNALNLNESTQQNQVQLFKRERSHSVITEIARLQGEVKAYKEMEYLGEYSGWTNINSNIGAVGDNNQGTINNLSTMLEYQIADKQEQLTNLLATLSLVPSNQEKIALIQEEITILQKELTKAEKSEQSPQILHQPYGIPGSSKTN